MDTIIYLVIIITQITVLLNYSLFETCTFIFFKFVFKQYLEILRGKNMSNVNLNMSFSNQSSDGALSSLRK